MAIFKRSNVNLKRVDTYMRRLTGRCIGATRGSFFTIRMAGIVPTKSRNAQLRLRFLVGVSSNLTADGSKSLARRAYEATLEDRYSRLRAMTTRCKYGDTAVALARKYAQQLRAETGQAVMDARHVAPINAHAAEVALRSLTWREPNQRLKLLQLQVQDYTKPHPMAYVLGDAAELTQR
jgi:hypothetical protein